MTHESTRCYIEFAIIFDNFTLNNIFDLKKIISFIALFLSFNTLFAQETDQSPTEYRVESFQTPLVAKKMMYDWFGKWNKVIYTEDNKALLVWTNRAVISESPEVFTIITSSIENEEEMFGTVQILTSNGHDALAKNSPYREYLNEFIKTLSKQKNTNKKFFKEYLKVEY